MNKDTARLLLGFALLVIVGTAQAGIVALDAATSPDSWPTPAPPEPLPEFAVLEFDAGESLVLSPAVDAGYSGRQKLPLHMTITEPPSLALMGLGLGLMVLFPPGITNRGRREGR